MKTSRIIAIAFSGLLFTGPGFPAETDKLPAIPNRIGVYDSRMVAYAHFWSEEHQKALQVRAAEAETARRVGNLTRYKALSAELGDERSRINLQVFSIAPIQDVLDQLRDKLPALQKEAGVSRFVSQWDESSLRAIAPEDRIDVTSLLVGSFRVPEARLKQLDQMKLAKPLPLWKARLLNFFSRL